jgi:ferritin-like metal-binding protein YciE
MEQNQNQPGAAIFNGEAGSIVPQKLTISRLFENGLREMYAAENLLINSLAEFTAACFNPELGQAIKEQLGKTERQQERLNKIFSRLVIEKEQGSCKVVETLVEEAFSLRENSESNAVRDAALIITLQKIEHYQIAAYGSLCELANLLGYNKIAAELDRSLEEEEFTDHLLTNLAWVINDDALENSEQQSPEAE